MSVTDVNHTRSRVESHSHMTAKSATILKNAINMYDETHDSSHNSSEMEKLHYNQQNQPQKSQNHSVTRSQSTHVNNNHTSHKNNKQNARIKSGKSAIVNTVVIDPNIPVIRSGTKRKEQSRNEKKGCCCVCCSLECGIIFLCLFLFLEGIFYMYIYVVSNY